MSRIVFLSGVATVFLTAAGCGMKSGTGRHARVERLPFVETVPPRREPLLPLRVEVNAQVEPMEKADLCARVPGLVETLQLDPARPEIDIGRKVVKDEPLLRIAVPELVAEQRYKEALAEQAKRQREQARQAQNVAAKELAESRELEKRYMAEFTQRKAKHDRTLKLVQSGSLQPVPVA